MISETKNKFSPIGCCQAMVSNTEREGKGDPTTRPMLGMLIFPNLGKGCPYIWWYRHLWCQTGREWVATGRLCKAVRYMLRFCHSFEVKFWLPQFRELGHLWGGPSLCQMGRQWLPTDRITKPLGLLGVCYGFAAMFNLIFWLPEFWGKRCP